MTSASPSPNDQTLISAYALDKDDQAFRTLVEYYTPLVFGVALRRTGQQQLAEEISQNVFIALARKAGSLSHQQSIGAWLHRAATLESLRALRKDRNRKRHLAMIRDQQEPHDAAGDELWSEIRPLLDELLDRLSAGDRNVLIQHFFEGLQFPEMAHRTLQSWAKHEPEQAIAWMRDELGDHEERDGLISGAMQTLVPFDLQKAMEGMSLIRNQEQLRFFWNTILQDLEQRSRQNREPIADSPTRRPHEALRR